MRQGIEQVKRRYAEHQLMIGCCVLAFVTQNTLQNIERPLSSTVIRRATKQAYVHNKDTHKQGQRRKNPPEYSCSHSNWVPASTSATPKLEDKALLTAVVLGGKSCVKHFTAHFKT